MNPNKQEVICNECSKIFILRTKNIKKKIIDNVKITYFECNKCKKKYIISCIDEHVKQLQRDHKESKVIKQYSDELGRKYIDKL